MTCCQYLDKHRKLRYVVAFLYANLNEELIYVSQLSGTDKPFTALDVVF